MFLERKYHIKEKDKIKVIYNFLDRDEELENIRHKKINNAPFSLLYVHGGSVHKSPDLVAKIVTELLKTNLDFRFYWTGKPVIPLTTTIFKHSKLKSIKQLFPKDDRLVFPGYIEDKREFDRFFASVNVILALSNNEGCSMALLEGHRSGAIYVVADYDNSNKEIVSKGHSGYVVNHNDVDGFVKIITELIVNHSKYECLYEKSHQAYIDYLTYPVWKKGVFEVLNTPVKHKQRKSKVTRLGILMGVWKMKSLMIRSLIDSFITQSFPSYISLYKQYRLAKKCGVADSRM